MQNALMAEINNLSVSERILLVEDIWDHLIDSKDYDFVLTENQRTELERRITYYQDKPGEGRYWNDLKVEYFSGKQ